MIHRLENGTLVYPAYIANYPLHLRAECVPSSKLWWHNTKLTDRWRRQGLNKWSHKYMFTTTNWGKYEKGRAKDAMRDHNGGAYFGPGGCLGQMRQSLSWRNFKLELKKWIEYSQAKGVCWGQGILLKHLLCWQVHSYLWQPQEVITAASAPVRYISFHHLSDSGPSTSPYY